MGSVFHLGGGSAASVLPSATFSLGGRPSSALSPTQALVASFAGTGLLDALLVFDPAHYSAPGNTPGVLVDALGGPIIYAAPNTQATPAAVQDASGYSYAVADGVDDTLVASATQTVAWYGAVFRSPGSVWNNFASIIDNSVNPGSRLGIMQQGGTYWVTGDGLSTPRGVRKDEMNLGDPFDLAPITTWQMVSVSTHSPTTPIIAQLCGIYDVNFLSAHLAALAIRYTDPTADQQSQIETRLTPMKNALAAA